MFNRDPQKAEARAAQRAERRASREAQRDAQREAREALREWRADHPAETQLKQAAFMHPWATSECGITTFGPIAGGRAEFFNADAHKGWTATRLVAGVATLGASAAATGRKNKGAAAINVTFGNGNVQSWNVKPDRTELAAANRYVTAFNALAAQLAAEQK
ncbi:hypothetical protein [Streptomyces decoyicus]